MTKRATNIALNLTDDDEPAVAHQNPDGSITEYATPKDPDGSATAENVPSPLAAAISAFTEGIDHPEDFTDTDLQVIGVGRLNPSLTHSALSDRLDVSVSTISRARRRATHAELSDREEIQTAFRERTDRQQATIAALVTDPECSRELLSEVGDCQRNAAAGIQRTFRPLVRHLREVGLPAEYDLPGPLRAHTEQSSPSDDSITISERLDEIQPAVRAAVDEDDATITETLDTVGTLIDYPTAYTETDLTVMVLDRLQSSLSDRALAQQIDSSATTIRRARTKAEIATLSSPTELHEYLDDLAEFKQNVIIAAVQHPDSSRSSIADLAGTSPATANTRYTEYKPLIYRLRAVGLPAELRDRLESTESTAADETANTDSSSTDNTSQEDEYACPECGETFETVNQRNGHTAVHSTTAETSGASAASAASDDSETSMETDANSAALDRALAKLWSDTESTAMTAAATETDATDARTTTATDAATETDATNDTTVTTDTDVPTALNRAADSDSPASTEKSEQTDSPTTGEDEADVDGDDTTRSHVDFLEIEAASPTATPATPDTASPTPTAGEPARSIPRTEITHLRQFVAGLRDAAITEHTHSESPVGQQSTAARRAVCETILDRLETILADEPTSPEESSPEEPSP
jgi:transposase-like protein